MNNKKKDIAIILAKAEDTTFNRYLIPVLGRTVVSYPILAATHCPSIDEVYLHTDSQPLIGHVANFGNVRNLPRTESQLTLTEEIGHALETESKASGYVINSVTILFANSPCVHADQLTNALRILNEKAEIDSVVSTMRRSEFDPSRVFELSQDGLLKKIKTTYPENANTFFLDRRFMVMRWADFRVRSARSNSIEGLLGAKTYPMIQDEGIGDIDYPWEVPLVERWLRQNGFTEERTPYETTPKPHVTAPGPSEKRTQVLKVLISTVPFGDPERTPLDLLESTKGVSYVINPLGRKFKEDEIAEYIRDFDILIAGTEKITKKVLANAKQLKLISRVGIGLDSVDLEEARRLGIKVSYTPEAPSPAVAELTIAHMLNLLRRLPTIDRKMRSGVWQRIMGERLANQTVGVIGTGRVGKRVIKLLQSFHPRNILVNDLNPDHDFYRAFDAVHAEKERIFAECDVITLHVPLTKQTKNLIGSPQFRQMKKKSVLINTSRGGIVNEHDLHAALNDKTIAGAAIDVFEEEPYSGPLIEMENCLVSCHMGSMTDDCRTEMERLATEEAVRFATGQALQGEVPEEEYENAGVA